MRPYAKSIAVGLFFLVLGFPQQSLSQTKITFSVRHSQDVTVTAGKDRKSDSRLSGGELSFQANGAENSQCQQYGRLAHSDGRALSQTVSSDDNEIVILLKNSAFARGGHFRTCETCAFGRCVGIHGNDVDASAKASAIAIVTVQAQSDLKRYSLLVNVSTDHISGGISYVVRARSLGDAVVQPLRDSPGVFLMDERTGPLVIHATSSSSANHGGGSGDEQRTAQGLMTVRVKPAPIIFSGYANYRPFVRGGIQTDSYTNVVSIGLDGQIHCSGTLVGKRTILTAAHCVYAYKNQIKEGLMDVRFGSNFFFGTPRIKVLDHLIAEDAAAGILFNPRTLEDDIALLFLEADAPEKLSTGKPILIAPLHIGKPEWDQIRSNNRSLIIVGFGYNVIDNQHVGSGIKREAPLVIDDVRNRTIFFKTPEQNTCQGDSGGPMFIEHDGKLLLAAVTSGGDDDCTQGVNTRTDAYLSWLNSKIK